MDMYVMSTPVLEMASVSGLKVSSVDTWKTAYSYSRAPVIVYSPIGNLRHQYRANLS